MTSFNRAAFNRKSSGNIKPTGHSSIKVIVAKAEYKVNKHVINKVYSNIKVSATGQFKVIKKAPRGHSKLTFLVQKALGGKKVFATGKSNIVVTAKAIGNIYGEEYFELRNLNLKPGEEIIIDMCELTVTKNGVNAVNLIEVDSDFFDFFPNINEINVEANTSKLAISTFWKDRWL